MTGYILKATAGQSIADNLFYKLSTIAYSKPLVVKSVTMSKATSEKSFTLEVHGDSEIIEDALCETRACLGEASDQFGSSSLHINAVNVELSVM